MFRRLAILLMIGVYSFIQLKPIFIVAADLLAHLVNEITHLSTVHLENGKYHVHMELKTEAEKKKNNSQTENERNLPHHLAQSQELIFTPTNEITISCFSWNNSYPLAAHQQLTTPPPKAIGFLTTL
jgi:hypothetical protein